MALIYNRILLKLSGELFASAHECVDARMVDGIAREIAVVVKMKVGVAVVVGGGNIMRGRKIKTGIEDEMTGHRAGMIATVVNGLMLERALIKHGVDAMLSGAFPIPGFVEMVTPASSRDHVRNGKVMVYVGGTGTPFVSTDSAVVSRALEIGAQAIFKIMTDVDGVYTQDPKRFKGAKKFGALSYDEAISQKLGVMDLDAFIQAHEYKLPIHVFKWGKGRVMKVVKGERIGSIISG